jgi:hypothetical protein
VKDADSIEISLRLTATGVLLVDGLFALICVLKGKYRTALFGLFLPPVLIFGAVRLARPTSIWSRHRYQGKRLERAQHRAADFDKYFDPLQTDWVNLIGGKPSRPNPPSATPPSATPPPATAPSANASPPPASASQREQS